MHLGDLRRAHRRDRVRVDVDPVEPLDRARDVAGRMRRADREDQLDLLRERAHGAGVAKALRALAGRLAASLGRPHDVVPFLLQDAPDRRAHLTRVQQPDDHNTSASTKAKKAREMTPFMVKNAASSRRRSPGRTSVCS